MRCTLAKANEREKGRIQAEKGEIFHLVSDIDGACHGTVEKVEKVRERSALG